MAEAPDAEPYEYDPYADNPELRECVNALSARDAILEPGIAKTFEQFLDLGGKEKEGAHILAESYVGLPHVLNVMIEWLHVAGYRKREIQAMVEDHLKHLITQHFDPKKADLIFTEEGSVPSWLEEMIQFPTWRELFYQLAEQYPDCLMLKFTIKLVSDAGFQSEITSASTAQHQPEVFSGLVKSALLQITTGRITDAHEHLRDFKQLVCHSQHTYFYSHSVLQSLSGTSQLIHFRKWLGQEIHREALLRKHEVTNMDLHFNCVGSHSRLFESLSSMLSRSALNPADISILYKHYTEEDPPPPVQFLQTPQLLELLVQAFFKPGSTINKDHKEKYLHILAYASSVYDNEDGERCVDELEPTKKALETAHMICSKATVSHTELQVEVPTLFQCIKYPVVSLGVLRWVEHTLSDLTFFEEAAESSPLFLVLLDEIAACHKLQHPFILDLLKRLIEGSYPMLEVHVQMELKRHLVEHLVQLLSCGYVLEVVNYMHRCMKTENLDHSLIRHFISEVLNIIQPPYSAEFGSVFLPLVQNQDISGPLVNADATDIVSQFVAECPRKTRRKKKNKL
jgi:negative elongation factor C/D